MNTYKANQVVEIPNLQVWLATYGGLVFATDAPGASNPYYTENGYLLLAEFPMSFAVRPNYNETADKIAALETRKAAVTKEFNETIGKLTAEITKLQAIENDVPTESIVLDEWYFTFGSNHAHPKGYVVIAGTYEGARKKMTDVFGDKWAFQYSKEDFGQKAALYGLHEVELDDDLPF